ncbi:hypothetical protein MLD52_00875 [Puniceicoccaceae bacterium K14]|nr:hypothetical protein [Puniceicoccaceae bacterium K14]
MRKRKKCWEQSLSALAILAAAFVMTGCGGEEKHHNHDHSHHHVHAHHAPHGGALSMLGDHAFQLELVPDGDSGNLALYVLDGEAENFIRVSITEFEATAIAGEGQWNLKFEAVASEATGETVGSSSYFIASAPEVSKLAQFDVQIGSIELLGNLFENVSIPYPEGKH